VRAARLPKSHAGGAAVVLVCVLASHPAAGQRCATPRPFSDEESSFVREQRRALLALVPEAPSGWVRRSVTESATAAPLCDDAGYKPPLFVRVVATYLPFDAPELSRRPAPTPPASTPRSTRRLVLRLQVNPTSFQSCGRSTPIEIEGSAVAFRATGTTCRDRTPGDVVFAAFGSWKTGPTPSGAFLASFNEWPAPPVARTKAHTALVEIAGDPDAVDAVVAVFDPARLRLLVAP